MPVLSPDRETPWALGSEVALGADPQAKAAMVSGWAQPEGPHVWNDGPESRMLLAVSETGRPLILSVTGIPLIHQQRPFQEITLFVNGYRLGFWRMRRADVSLLSATIAPEQMRVSAGCSQMQLDWHIPFSVSPSALGAGADGRELGFCFQTLSLRAA